MIVEPEQRVADFAKAGADIISIHAEQSATIHLDRTINQARSSVVLLQALHAVTTPCGDQAIRPECAHACCQGLAKDPYCRMLMAKPELSLQSWLRHVGFSGCGP